MALRRYQIAVVIAATVFLFAASLTEADGIADKITDGTAGGRSSNRDRSTHGIVEAAHRHIRSLSYPKESEMGIFFALAIPLDDPLSKKSVSVAFFFEAVYRLNETPPSPFEKHEERRSRRSLDRRTLYALLESKFESLGFPGKQCLLRSICETAREHWNHALREHNGLVGDLMRIIFRPSASEDEDLAPEYIRAEDAELDCASSYRRCPFSIYQYISE